MQEELLKTIVEIRAFVWGMPLLLLLLGTGLYLTILLRGLQFSHLGFAIREVFRSKQEGAEGDINHFEALMTTLAGAIGTGAIVGVSTAVCIGGLGAIFWMWVTAILGMATKYSESLLAVKYREKDQYGEMIGGPMEYIEKGLGWRPLAILFAIFGCFAAIGTGNLVQVNSIAEAAQSVWDVNPWVTGVITAVVTAIVILGGVKSIGHVAGVLVPVMALFYFLGGSAILVMHAEKIPEAFYQIFYQAFKAPAVTGGFVGGGLLLTIQTGVARSVFSNEAGLGISSIAAAAAQTDSPSRQALITMTGALLSTIVICTITGLAIAVTGCLEGQHGMSGAVLAINAFDASFSGGSYVVSIGLILFAFSTVIAWAYYGEKCCEYLLGERSILPYRLLFILIIIPAAAIEMEMAWYIADIANGLMAIPNLIALVALSSVIVSETRKFIDSQ